MKAKLLIILSFVSFYVSAQIQNFNTKVKFNNVDIVDSADVNYIYTVGSNGIMTKVLKSQIGGSTDLSNYYTKPETENLISDSLSNYIPLTGTRAGSPLSGYFQIAQNTEFNTYTAGLDRYSALYFDEFGNFKLLSNDDSLGGTQVALYSNGTDIFIENSTGTTKGLVGQSYYGANYDDNTYIQKKFFDDNIPNLVAGTNITIDNTDPLNPIISASGGGGSTPTLNDVLTEGNESSQDIVLSAANDLVISQLTGINSGTVFSNVSPGDYLQRDNLTSALSNYILTSQKGANNGVASLNSSGKLPSSQLELVGTNFGLNSTGGVNLLPVWNGSTSMWQPFIQYSSSVINNTIAMRGSGGTIKGATATASDDLTRLDQTTTLTGNQTIAGVKTFSSSPIVPTATLSTQAVNKGQLDASIVNMQTRKVFPLTEKGGISVPAGAFDLALFNVCVDYFGFKNWDITWWDGQLFKTLKTEYIMGSSTALRLDISKGCIYIVGNTSVAISIPASAELILEY